MSETNTSVQKMWADYHSKIGLTVSSEPVSDFFCYNEKDANALAALVDQGIKRATASSLWTVQKTNAKMPKVGDLFIVTDWNKKAVCIVKIIKVSVIPFHEITEEHAYTEGEGDKSLEYWRRVHIEFFEKEFEELGFVFNESMPIVFEEFEKVFP